MARQRLHVDSPGELASRARLRCLPIMAAGLVAALTALASTVRAAELAYSWHAPDRAAKVAELIPGRQLAMPPPEQFMADWTRTRIAMWERDHEPLEPEEAYQTYAKADTPDDQLEALIPDHISPFGRVLEGDPGRERAEGAMVSYCPLCGAIDSWLLPSVRLDPDNPFHATTACCGQDLYEREQDMPDDYKLRPNSSAEFVHLDGTVKAVPAYEFTDKQGVKWQIFPGTLVAHARWGGVAGRADGLMNAFYDSGNPLYVHKLAALLDRVAEVYYGLPLSYRNELATGEDGKPLTRAEWEAWPRPLRAGYTCNKSPWNRGRPCISRGWVFQGNELTWVEPFARVRHHPTFKYYSQKKYGDPEALDRKIMTKLMRELALLFESFPLQSDYQDGAYTDLMMLGILLENEYLFDFAAGHQECVLYNHHYHDGMNGEGAPNYMDMLNRYYRYMADPHGWLEFAPDFLEKQPFFAVASSELRKVCTIRGNQLGFGDQHNYTFGRPFTTDPEQVKANEKWPSMNWPGYGIGILRVGGHGHRQEVFMTYDRVSLHGAGDKLGIECWVDGVPVMREGGYAAHWHTAYLDKSKPEIQAFLKMPYPHEPFECRRYSGMEFDCWTWAHSHIAHNTASVNELGTGLGWSDNEGFGELVTFKGGEVPDEPGASFQVLDSRDLFSFERMGVEVDEFRRALLAVEGPDGRPYAVDILRLKGGQRHALYQSAWAERAEENLPPVASEEPDLAVYLDKLRNQPPDSLPSRREYRQVRPLQVLEPPPALWGVIWKTDYAAYAPFKADGTRPKRPLPEDVGRVRLRLIGLKQDDNTTLLRGRGPWVTHINQPLPNGETLTDNLAFRDAWDFLIESRALPNGQDQETLKSLYLHVLEGFREGEASVIAAVKRLPLARATQLPQDVVALSLAMGGGHTDTVIFQPAPGEVRLHDGLSTDARYALVRRDAGGEVTEAHLVRGSSLKCGKFSATVSGDFTGTIVDLVGDLTGTRLETALIVRPDSPWPLDFGLAGKPISIDVVNGHKEAYDIAKVTALGEGLVRVDLAKHAPLSMGWYQVSLLDSEKPNRLTSNRELWAGINSPWWWGAKAWFVEKDQTYTIAKTHSDRMTMDIADEVDLAAQGIASGDWFVIYAIAPGQTVSVPCELAWRRDRNPAGDASGSDGGFQRYSMSATGAATITMPAENGDIWLRIGGGKWQQAAAAFEPQAGVATLTVPASENADQVAWLLTDKPDWLELDDSGPPRITKVLLDDESLELKPTLMLGRIPPPKTLVIEAEDDANRIDRSSIVVNLDGKRIDDNRDLVAISLPPADPKCVTIRIDMAHALAGEEQEAPAHHTVTIALDDLAVDRQSTSFSLSYRKLVDISEDVVYLSDLQETSSFVHGGLRKDTDYFGRLLQMGGDTYEKGLHTHPETGSAGHRPAHSEVIYDLGQAPDRKLLKAIIGVDDTAGTAGSVVFQVQVSKDGEWETRYSSPVMRGGQEPLVISVDISGASKLKLYCTDAGDGINSDHAAWADVRLE